MLAEFFITFSVMKRKFSCQLKYYKPMYTDVFEDKISILGTEETN